MVSLEMNNKFDKVIAIDGPAGAGKSVVAQILAEKLNTLYIDTGAMYRAVTFKILQEGIDFDDKKALSKILDSIDITFKKDNQGNVKILMNGKDVTNKLRSKQVNKNISNVARNKLIRKRLVKLQRKIGKAGGVVEGRDIATVVFPNAYKKFYLDAHLEERIRRRYIQAKQQGREVDESTVKEEIIKRDRSDRTRKISPLQIAPDAIYIDTTNLSIEKVVQKLLDFINRN